MTVVLFIICIASIMYCMYHIGCCAKDLKIGKVLERTIANVNPDDGEFARGALWAIGYILDNLDK